MSSEYVPTTEEVRLEYMAVRWGKSDIASFEARAEFDRWLAEYTREKQAEAWSEGRKSGLDTGLSIAENVHGNFGVLKLNELPRPTENPYRKEKNNE